MITALIGLNHESASLEIRELLSFSDSKKIEVISDILDLGISEITVLSTCSRSEFYIADKACDIDEKVQVLMEYLAKVSSYENISNHLYIKIGDDVAKHLFRVSAGLDSIVLGEDQILGQVRDAQRFSMDVGGSKKILNKLFRDAITTSKHIKTELKISEHPLSLSYIGIKFLKESMGDLAGKKAMIVGYGKMGSLAMEYLVYEGVKDITIVGRNLDKFKDFSIDSVRLNLLDYSSRYEQIGDMDIIISSTSASHFVITKDKLPKLTKKLYFLDLALPRDVDPSVKDDKNVKLFSIDDLKDHSEKNIIKRDELAREASGIIDEKVNEFKEWLKNVKSDRFISSLQEHVEVIEKDTMDYLLSKMELSCKNRMILEKMVKSSLKRVIRNPILKLKSIEDDEKREKYLEMLEEVFDLKVED